MNSTVAWGAAAAVVVLLGLRIDVYPGITVGEIATLVVLPLWARSLRLYRGARLLMIVGAIAVAGGFVLFASAPAGHRFSMGNLTTYVSIIVGIPLGAGFLLWARRLMASGTIMALLGAGMLLGVNTGATLFSSNPWKFGYAVPVALLLLGVADLIGRRSLQVLLLLAFAGVAAVSDARSDFGVLLISAVLMAWPGRPRLRNRAAAAAVLFAFAAAATVGIYSVAQSLILDGAFGAGTQVRSQAQIEAGGSLLLGGRPEWGAAVALFKANPLGFGPERCRRSRTCGPRRPG